MTTPNLPASSSLPQQSYQLTDETVSIKLNGYTEQVGTVTSPAAYQNILYAPVPPGTYTVNWTVILAGTLTANDANNFAIYNGNTFIASSIDGDVAGSYPQAAQVFTVTAANPFIKILAGGATPTVGAVYTAVLLQVNGSGTATITPGAPSPGGGVGVGRNSGLTWDVVGVAVSVAPVAPATAPVEQAQCSVFLSYGIQSAGPNDFQGQTATGSTGDTDTLTATIRPGDWITAIWTGGDPGAIATMRILGTVNPPGT